MIQPSHVIKCSCADDTFYQEQHVYAPDSFETNVGMFNLFKIGTCLKAFLSYFPTSKKMNNMNITLIFYLWIHPIFETRVVDKMLY